MILDNPFTSVYRELLEDQKYSLSPDTISELEKRYARMSKDINRLFETGRLSSNNPAFLSVNDIKEVYAYYQEKGTLSPQSISKELCALNSLCKFCGNTCVESAKARYKALSCRNRQKPISLLSNEQYEILFKKASELTENHYVPLRSFAMLVLSVSGGLRRKEIRYAKIKNLNLDAPTLYLDRVKGERTYGSERLVPLRFESVAILEKYLVALELIEHPPSDYLFPNLKTGEPLSDSSLDRIRADACESLGFEITFQKCRRTYGQNAVDDGLGIDDVSRLMGHSSTMTTEMFYARNRAFKAVNEALKCFNEKYQRGGCSH